MNKNIGLCIIFNISYNPILYATGCLNLNDRDLMNMYNKYLILLYPRLFYLVGDKDLYLCRKVDYYVGRIIYWKNLSLLNLIKNL